MPVEPIVHRMGGGDDRYLEFVTDGRVHTRLHRSAPVWDHTTVSVAPSAVVARGQTFFRLDENGKMQFCVLFPTGVTQVLATEP